MPNFLIAFLIAFIVSSALTALVRKFALQYGILDHPTSERKVHQSPKPLMGGLAIYMTFILVSAGYAFFTDQLITGYLLGKHLVGIVLGGLILMIGGYLDDKYDLPPKQQIMFPIIAVLVVILFGIGITSISNPFAGGTIYFDQLQFEILRFNGVPYFITVLADLFAFIWLMGMMYTTKYLDGLDGLASGVSMIAALIIFFVAQDLTLQQDYIALLAIIFVGALGGFLLFNFNPASLFLGEGGSLFTGFMIGVLAILSGSKIATALLVFGVPIFDVTWVIARRLMTGKKVTQGDKKHLHHRFLDAGLSHKASVLVIYLLVALFGITALFLQTIYKLYVLGGLVVTMIVLAFLLISLYNKRKQTYGS